VSSPLGETDCGARGSDRRWGPDTLDLDESAREWLAAKGYDPVYGARPLKRVIQREVQDPLADKMLAGEVPEGSRVKITGGTDKLLFLLRVTGGKSGKAA
jgi:ATP-dependent Clp protease ATP-binding subunit ClpB